MENLKEIPEVLTPVLEHIDEALSISWDGCHKIYLALDETEATWFAENYEHTYVGDRNFMMNKIVEWWDESCFLRFVSGVRHNSVDPNLGFVQIVEQGA